jgi:hypothetical protein
MATSQVYKYDLLPPYSPLLSSPSTSHFALLFIYLLLTIQVSKMKVSTVILSALFSFSFITALPLPADTSSLAYLAKKDITSLVPQYIKRQDEDFPDESGPGVDIPDDEDFPDEKFKR